MTTFELWFFIICTGGFIAFSWWERWQEHLERERERNRRNYGRND